MFRNVRIYRVSVLPHFVLHHGIINDNHEITHHCTRDSQRGDSPAGVFRDGVFRRRLLIVTIFVPYFTFGEDMKMYKDTGLTTISFFCMLLALLTASSTVADEIEGKTAITLLSKPINRRQFIVGKFLGIELGVLALYVLLGALFAAGVWYKYRV